MEYIDINGTMRKEYRNDGAISVHFDYLKEVYGVLTVSRDDEPIWNDIVQMIKRREERLDLMEEVIRAVDNALRYGHDLGNESYNSIYEDATGYKFKNIQDEKDETIAELRNEIYRLQRQISDKRKAGRSRRVKADFAA